jgi:hypothetical protein
MPVSTVYECPECGDRTMVDHHSESLPPTVWCNCEGFIVMDVVYDRGEEVTDGDD